MTGTVELMHQNHSMTSNTLRMLSVSETQGKLEKYKHPSILNLIEQCCSKRKRNSERPENQQIKNKFIH
jgi:hypothetical protein